MQKEKIISMLNTLQAEACLVTSQENRRYITGLKSTSAVVLITASGNAYYITDFRYIEETRSHLKGKDFTVIMENGSILSTVKKIIDDEKIKSLAFENMHTTCFEYESLKSVLKINLVPIGEGLREIRLVKSGFEIECIKTSLKIAEQSLEETFKAVKAGMSEFEVLAKLTYNLLSNGSELGEFGIVATSGARSSLPHGKASDKKLAKGDFLLVDFGAIYKGYYSDITRTAAIGSADDKMRQVYEIVLQANLAGIEAVTAGKKAAAADKAARDIIAKAGYGEYFLHGLGHGVGHEIHEKPRLAANSDDVLEIGNVVTVEPGIYIPGEFGIRIEDMLLVTGDKAENLTSMSKELRVLG